MPKKTLRQNATITTNKAYPELTQSKIFKGLLYLAHEVRQELERGSIHEIHYSELDQLTGYHKGTEWYDDVVDSCRKLELDWSKYYPDTKGISHPISCSINTKTGIIRYAFDPLFVEEYLNNKIPYKNIPIDVLMDMRSNYAMKVYEYAVQFYNRENLNQTTPHLYYKELRELFNVPDDIHKRKFDFMKWVIKEPMKEANELGDFKITFHETKGSPKVRKYYFKCQPNSQQEFPFAKQLKKKELPQQTYCLLEIENWNTRENLLGYNSGVIMNKVKNGHVWHTLTHAEHKLIYYILGIKVEGLTL